MTHSTIMTSQPQPSQVSHDEAANPTSTVPTTRISNERSDGQDTTTAPEANNGPLFVNIDPDNPVMEIESLCMQCRENGLTRILLTKIPHFKEVIIMAFECPHCHFRNNEIQSAGEIQER